MFKIPELLEATGGRLISGSADICVKGVSIDSRTVKKDEAFIAVKGERFDGHDFIPNVIKKGVSCIIAQRDVTLARGKCDFGINVGGMPKSRRGVVFIMVQDTTKALGDIAAFNRARFKDIPVIAVTGSNGKTTVKEMVAWILSGKFRVLKNEGTKNNHIGLPLTLLKLDSSYDLAVLEIGTNHFGEVGYLSGIAQANIGIIANIGPSHLEYFKDLRGVFREKYELIKNLNKPGIAILNSDDQFLRKEALRKAKRPFVLNVGIDKKGDFSAGGIRRVSGKYAFTVNKRFKFTLKALGYYNVYNGLLAIAVARVFGLGYREISSRLSSFNLPKSRLSFIKIRGVSFIDDTYNSNPLSMKQALGALGGFTGKGRKILVMGDMLELGDKSISLHAKTIKDALKLVDIIITVGKLAKSGLEKNIAAKNIFTPLHPKSHVYRSRGVAGFTCGTSSEARDVLFKTVRAQKEDIVLVKGSRGMKMEEVFRI